MKLHDFELGPRVCMEAFPFHLILDKDLSIHQVGDGLRKLIPAIEPGKHFQEFLVEHNSPVRLSYHEIESRISTTFQFQSHTNSAVEIRGGFYSIDDSYLLFLADPVIHDTSDIARLSLKFGDFARHHPFLYYIAALQAKEALLRDSRVLVNQLEGLVAKRTEQLQERAEKLRLIESRLNSAQRMAKIGNWDWNLVTNEMWWSEERYRIAERDPETFKPTEESFLEIVHPEDRKRMRQAVENAANAGEPYSMDFRAVLPDGSVRSLHTQTEVFNDEKGRPVRMVGTTQDITKQVELEREIVAAGEHERNRIGRDLHDGLGQDLTGIFLRLQGLSQELARERSPHVQAMRDLTAMIQNTIAETRRVARDLAPGFSIELGIGAALRALVEEVNEHSDVKCHAHYSHENELHDAEIATHLYRIAQESINNALRHSGAQNIELQYGHDGDSLFLEVLDDGTGIQAKGSRGEGMGLRSMHYRARMLGGRLEVGLRSQGGTRVLCSCPVLPDQLSRTPTTS